MAAPAITTTSAITPGNLQSEIVHRAAWKAGTLGALNTIFRVLNARLLVLLAVSGGIMLAYSTLSHPDWLSLGVLIIYCIGVVFPVAFLAAWWR